MRTYCKRLVVSDAAKIRLDISNYLHDKYKKNSTVKFVSHYMNRDQSYVRENFIPGIGFWGETIGLLAKDMAEHIRSRRMKEHIISDSCGYPVIRYMDIRDGGSGKIRTLGLETVLFRLYEVVASNAAQPLWNAKFGVYQVSSIKKRGQTYGQKAVKKWLSSDVEGTKYMGKGDIRQCYPSIPHNNLRYYLQRDLHKSGELLYMFLTFIDLYEEWPSPKAEDPQRGILIGSPASKDLCNYFLSYAYHYASEKLVKTSARRGKVQTKQLVAHVMFYADDIVLYSGNKKDIHSAVRQLISYLKDALGLQLKPDWVITKTMYADKTGKIRGGMLDYMGFRFHGGATKGKEYLGKTKRHKKVWVTLRRRIFLCARRKRKKFSDMLRKKVQPGCKFVQSVIAQYGWFKNSNMVKYRKKHQIDRLMKIARRIVSGYAKGRKYNADKYYKEWRKLKYA